MVYYQVWITVYQGKREVGSLELLETIDITDLPKPQMGGVFLASACAEDWGRVRVM